MNTRKLVSDLFSVSNLFLSCILVLTLTACGGSDNEAAPLDGGATSTETGADTRETKGAEEPAPGAAGSETQVAGTSNEPSGESVSWPTLWNSARLGELLSRREELLADNLEESGETLALAALFLRNMDLAVEIRASLPETSLVGNYIDSLTKVLTPGAAPEEIQERFTALREMLDSWTPNGDKEAVLKANAEAFAMASMGLRTQAFGQYSETVQKWQDNSVALRNLASMYMAADMPKHAVAAVKRLVDLRGNVPELRNLLYLAYTRARMDAEAQAFAEATFSLAPTDLDAIVVLSRIYLRSGQNLAAQRVIESGVRDLPGQQSLKILLANVMLKSGKAQEGLDLLDAQTIPADFEAMALEIRAHGLAMLGDWDEILSLLSSNADIKTVLSLRVLRVAALANSDRIDEALPPEYGNLRPPFKGMVQVVARALGSAEKIEFAGDEALAGLLKENPARLATFAHAIASRSVGLYQAAFESFDSLYLELPEAPRLAWYALESLSHTESQRGRLEKAEALVERSEGHPDALLGLASIYEAEEDTHGEQAALVSALDATPNRSDILTRLATFATRVGDLELAMSTYDTLIDLKPDDPTVLNNHAYYLLETGGDAELAEENAKKALEAMPSNPNILHTIGLAQLRQGKLEDSLRNLSMALQMRPGDPTLSLDFGKQLIAQGETERGKKFVAQALQFAELIGVPFDRKDEAIAIVGDGSERPAAKVNQA